MKRFWIRRALKFVVFVLVFVSLIGWAVQHLWNALMPDLFQLPLISFGQALGLVVLGRLICGFGFRGGPPWAQGGGWKGGGQHESWKEKMAERWKKMTPDQQERLRQRFQNRCGPDSPWGRRWPFPPEESNPPKEPS